MSDDLIPLLLCADHAGLGGRDQFGDLGIGDALWHSHFACDIGTQALTEKLATHCAPQAVINDYSRLFADVHRDPADPNCIPLMLDEAPVPGNCALDAQGREERIRCIHQPYHQRLGEAVNELRAKYGQRAGVMSIHSFTPIWGGDLRSVDIGFLVKHDEATALHLKLALERAFPQFNIMFNEPYSGWIYNYTLDRHLGDLANPQALIEIRQDHAQDASTMDQIVSVLAGAWRTLLLPGGGVA